MVCALISVLRSTNKRATRCHVNRHVRRTVLRNREIAGTDYAVCRVTRGDTAGKRTGNGTQHTAEH